MADDLVQGRFATEESGLETATRLPCEIPPKTKHVQCTSLRVGEKRGRRKAGGCHVQETGDDGVPKIIRMRSTVAR